MYKSDKVAEQIKKVAKIRKIQLKDMLLELKLNKNTMSNMYNGSMIKADSLARIADFLNCSVDYLLERTNTMDMNSENLQEPKLTVVHTKPKSALKSIIKPLYLTPASAGTGSWLDDDTPAEWITVPKSEKTVLADFLIKVRGDSMQPKYYDGDIVLVKQSNSITEGEYGVFILNNEAFIKKMGKGELISLNPDYDNIAVSEYDTISCAGKVIGVLESE